MQTWLSKRNCLYEAFFSRVYMGSVKLLLNRHFSGNGTKGTLCT